MFSQITKRSATIPRLLLGATLAAGVWIAVCVSCFVDLGSLPSALKAPLTTPAPTPSCVCPSKQAEPARLDAEHAIVNEHDPLRPPLPCRT